MEILFVLLCDIEIPTEVADMRGDGVEEEDVNESVLSFKSGIMVPIASISRR